MGRSNSNTISFQKESGPILIETSHLTKYFGANKAVDDVNLVIHAGEIYGLVGPDGAGKTTTMRLICGAFKIGQGEAFIAGYKMSKQPEKARQHIGYIAQKFSLYEELSVLENLRFFAEVRGLTAEDWLPRCREILKFVGLSEFTDRWAGKLSGGMRQKLGLAAALVHRPKILLLDEPTTGVDPVTRQDFWQLIIRLVSEEEVAVLVTTPYMDEAARCTRVGFMRDGKILREGTPAYLRSFLNDQIVELIGQPLAVLRQIASEDEGIEDAQLFGDRLHLRVKQGQREKVITRLKRQIVASGIQATRMNLIQPSLEDVFIALSETGPVQPPAVFKSGNGEKEAKV